MEQEAMSMAPRKWATGAEEWCTTPPDRGRYGLLRGRMMGDLQVGLGLGPGFGQQPDAAPEATLEQQPPEPIDAVADYADGARRTTTRVPVIGSQRFGRCPQAAWCNPPVLGVFHPGAVGQGQQCGHRQHQPVAGDAGRVGAPGLVPLPAQALDGLEAQFDPEAQGVPAGSGVLRRQVGEDDPGFFLLGYQTTSRVQRRWAVGGPKAVPRPTQAVSGTETKARAGNRLPPSAQKVMFFR